MPLSFTGNTSSSETSEALSLPTRVDYFSIVNKTNGAVVVNVYKITEEGNVCLMPLNQSLSANQMWEGTGKILVLGGEQIKVQVSGSVDYDFLINNIEPPTI